MALCVIEEFGHGVEEPGRKIEIADRAALLRYLGRLALRENASLFLFRANGDDLTIAQGRAGTAIVFHPAGLKGPSYSASTTEADSDEWVEVMVDSTPTPVTHDRCLPFELFERVVCDFVETDGLPKCVIWKMD